MKRKWSAIAMALLATVILMTTAVPALAQGEDELTADSGLWTRDGLAIIAPLGVPVGQPVTMTVLQRSDASRVQGAGVWALTRDEADALNERISALRESGEMASLDIDWESLVEVYGIFLGRTDERGKLEHAFSEAGRYVLLAVKRGYVPGRTGIMIGHLPRALGIKAPDRAPVGEPVLMTVFQRGTQEPITGAGIWALTREQAEALKEEMTAMQESADVVPEDLDWESLVSVRGIFLGRTGDDGSLEYAFEESGGYLLVTVKRGYLPGRKGICIGNLPQFLAMEVQRWAKVGDTVPMTVFERHSGDPVQGAGIWALTREQAEALREEMTAMRESDEASLADIDWESVVSIRGILLGRTDERGKLEYAFSEAGGYALVAVKRGYILAFAFIIIREPRPEVMQPDNVRFQRDAASIQAQPYTSGQLTEDNVINDVY